MILLWIVLIIAILCGLLAIGCVIGEGRIERMKDDDNGEPESRKRNDD